MQHTLKTLISALLLLLPLAGCGNAGDETQAPAPGAARSGIMTGQRAPDFTLNDLGGSAFALSELRGKKPALLIFWATWCPSCIQSIPYFSNIHAQYGPRGLEVVSINIASNDPLPRVQRFQEINKLPYRILYDETTDVSRTFAVFGIPTTLVIDRDGIIRYRGNLLPDNVGKLFDALLAPAS
jgi:peroxiredoxin